MRDNIEPLKNGTRIYGVDENGGRHAYQIVSLISIGGTAILYYGQPINEHISNNRPICLKEYLPFSNGFYREENGRIRSIDGTDWLITSYSLAKKEYENGRLCQYGNLKAVSTNHFFKVYRITNSERVALYEGKNKACGIFAEIEGLPNDRFFHTYELFRNIVDLSENGTNDDDKRMYSHCLNKSRDNFSIFFAVDMVKEVLSALDIIHINGCVHGDIHDGNILFTEVKNREISPGMAVFIDFGSAGVISKEYNGVKSENGWYTTEDYSPLAYDHKAGQPIIWTIQSDLYQVGAWMFYLVTGQLFNSYGRKHKIIRNKAVIEPILKKQYGDVLSDATTQLLIDILFRATNEDSAQRYPNAKSFSYALLDINEVRDIKTFIMAKEMDSVQGEPLSIFANSKISEQIEKELNIAIKEKNIIKYDECCEKSLKHNGSGYDHIITYSFPFFVWGYFDKIEKYIDSVLELFRISSNFSDEMNCLSIAATIYSHFPGYEEKSTEYSIAELKVSRKVRFNSNDERMSRIIKIFTKVIRKLFNEGKDRDAWEYALDCYNMINNYDEINISSSLFGAISYFYNVYAFLLDKYKNEHSKAEYFFDKSLQMEEGVRKDIVHSLNYCQFLISVRKYNKCRNILNRANENIIDKELDPNIQKRMLVSIFYVYVKLFYTINDYESFNRIYNHAEDLWTNYMLLSQKSENQCRNMMSMIYMYNGFFCEERGERQKAIESYKMALAFEDIMEADHEIKELIHHRMGLLNANLISTKPSSVICSDDLKDEVKKWIRVYNDEYKPVIINGNDNKTLKLVLNAIRKYGKSKIKTNDVFAIIDISLLRDGSKGCFFTQDRIYCSCLFEYSSDAEKSIMSKCSLQYFLYRSIKNIYEYDGYLGMLVDNNIIIVKNKKLSKPLKYIIGHLIEASL